MDKTKDYHITSFQWTSIYDIAKTIAKFYPDTIITRGKSRDDVQKNINNQPSDFIFNYWHPQIDIEDGIKRIIDYYEEQK